MLQIAVLASLFLPVAAGAQAQSAEAIRAHLARANPGCDIYRPVEAYRGPLNGAAGPVVVMIYTDEGCGGGNNWGRVFGVFAGTDGRVREYRQPDPPRFMVEAANVARGVLEVSGLAYGPGEARCCPTVHRSARYRIEGDALAIAR